jgi:hypothetical protein
VTAGPNPRLLACLCVVGVLLAGCKSESFGPYVSPRVEGQVVDANTLQPLPGVKVTRGSTGRGSQIASPPKGAELLMLKGPAITDSEGRFALCSERVLSIVRGSGWNQVHLAFELPGYLRFQTNLTVSAMTNTPGSEPVLNTGRVALAPLK